MAALATPDALERFSPLTGEPALLIDLDAKGPPVDASGLAAARRGLARLPAPSIGITSGRASELGAALSASLDVRVADADELADVLDALTRHPLSCCALVQLLRHSEPLDLHEALVAESLVYSTLQSGPEFRAWLAQHQRRTRPAASGPAVLVERDDTTLCLTFNRPEKRNAFSAEMRDALAEALMVAHGDPGLDIVLRGRGPAFCSGGDLDEFGTLPDPATAHQIRATRNIGRLLVDLAPRVRVEVQGACVGAGVELAAFAGRVCAAPDAFFQLPEIDLGLVPGAGGTASLPRRIGRQRTAWLALTRRRVDAATARSWGLIDALTSEPG